MPCTISGRVTSTGGSPEGSVLVRIEAVNVASQTGPDGAYRLVVPSSRIRPGSPVRITASKVMFAAASVMITLSEGEITQNFQISRDVL